MEEEVNDQLLAWAELIAIGEVARAQGRRGEVIVNPLTDFPERFHELTRVFIDGPDSRPLSLAVESVRWQKGRPVLKLASVSSIGDAETLAGKELRVPESELARLPEGSFYHFEIIGARVEDIRRGFLGIASDIVKTGGTDVLVVKREDGGEILLPLCAEICRRIDRDAGIIEVEAQEGLIDLNAR